VTRPRSQSFELAQLLIEAGASPLVVPLIEIAEPLDAGAALEAALRRVGEFDWVVFSSFNAVVRCWEHLELSAPLDGVKVAAIGAQTAAALRERGVEADLVPGEYLAESLVEAFPLPVVPGSSSVLVPCAAGARDNLAVGLGEKGWRVEKVEAYRTLRAEVLEADLGAFKRADAITFASSSAVTAFVQLAGLAALPPVVACLGQVTARTAERAGLGVDVVAVEHTAEGLVRALAGWALAARAREQN
jgi:uroporphyrinogen III methyltransferase/synthase